MQHTATHDLDERQSGQHTTAATRLVASGFRGPSPQPTRQPVPGLWTTPLAAPRRVTNSVGIGQKYRL